MQFSTSDIDRIRSSEVYGSDGQKLGKAGQVWLDDSSGQPEWVTVSTGLFGSKESFVPLSAAEWTGSGLQVPFGKDQVKGAANIEPDADHLSEEAEQELYRYYGLGTGTGTGGQEYERTAGPGSAEDMRTADTTSSERATDEIGPQYVQGTGELDHETDVGPRYVEGTSDVAAGAGRGSEYGESPASGEATGSGRTDEAMTRSEERLNVGTETVPTGRARLRKYVVTEEQQVTVPVQHEEVRIEREPISESNVEQATAGPEISEAEHEVTLHAERPVVTTEAVPVERVRLEQDTVSEQETVSGVVRQERVELEEEGQAEESIDDVDLSRERQRQS